MEQQASMNPNPSSSPNLETTLSSLNNLLSLSNHILSISPSPPSLNSNLIQCPFNPHHLIPPSSLFHHHLHCPPSPHPHPHPLPNNLLHSLNYPKTLHNPPSSQLSSYFHSPSNFFYYHCPGVVTFSDENALATTLTFTFPSFLSLECADIPNSETLHSPMPILPSEYWAISRELESWNDYPTTYSNAVLRAISGIGIAKESDFSTWIITNSPRYGVVIDSPMQQHIFLLCCLCFKSILREASVLNQALTWLESQVSILYGAINGKWFVLNFVKKCILVGASVLLLFPLGDDKVTEGSASKQESQNSDTKDEGKNMNCIRDRKIFVSQVVAAVAALHERALLERKINGLWFSQKPNNYQLVGEHCYLSEKANEERKKRLDYRPLIDHDLLHRQQSSNQETAKEKTREELLAEERDYKRRRMSYRGKKRNQSTTQVMRDLIEEYMEEIKQAGGVKSPVKVSEDSGMFPSKLPSGHDIPMVVNNSRKISRDSPATTINNPSYCEQQSRANRTDKSKAVDDVSSRDYEEQRKQGHYRRHNYEEDQRNADRQTYHRGRASTSPERQISHSQSHDHSTHHKKQDYSNRKKYDNSSRTRDRRQKDTHRNHISDSVLNNAFSDRYDPSESLDVWEDDYSSDAKYVKPDKFYYKELH